MNEIRFRQAHAETAAPMTDVGYASRASISVARHSGESGVDLVALVAHDSRAATMELYDRYCRTAYGLAIDLVGCPERAEQIVLRTFLVISRHAKSFNTQSCSVATWIATSIESFARVEVQPDS